MTENKALSWFTLSHWCLTVPLHRLSLGFGVIVVNSCLITCDIFSLTTDETSRWLCFSISIFVICHTQIQYSSSCMMQQSCFMSDSVQILIFSVTVIGLLPRGLEMLDLLLFKWLAPHLSILTAVVQLLYTFVCAYEFPLNYFSSKKLNSA